MLDLGFNRLLSWFQVFKFWLQELLTDLVSVTHDIRIQSTSVLVSDVIARFGKAPNRFCVGVRKQSTIVLVSGLLKALVSRTSNSSLLCQLLKVLAFNQLLIWIQILSSCFKSF